MCYCRPERRTPFCPSCPTAMLKKITEQQGEIMSLRERLKMAIELLSDVEQSGCNLYAHSQSADSWMDKAGSLISGQAPPAAGQEDA